MFHAGHRLLLERARGLAGFRGPLWVGVNSDAFVEEYKGRRPAWDEETRLGVVRALPYVDFAAINDGAGDVMVNAIRPALLVVGSDWHERDYLAQIGMTREELFGRLRCGVVYLPRTPGVSTTELRA